MQYYCGALLFRRDYASEDKTNMPDILRRLNAAAARLPNDAAPHCQLGKAYRWLEQWQAALRESEVCARWILIPHKRTIGWGRFIITRVRRNERNRK